VPDRLHKFFLSLQLEQKLFIDAKIQEEYTNSVAASSTRSCRRLYSRRAAACLADFLRKREPGHPNLLLLVYLRLDEFRMCSIDP
jgi:hypothetical protein